MPMVRFALSGAAAIGLGLAMGLGGRTTAKASELCVEDSVNGCIQDLGLNHPITVASDGEAAFHPFGLTFDVSDAIEFESIWTADVANTWLFQGIDASNGLDIWYAPAIQEIEPPVEGIGKWDALGFTVVGGPFVFDITESDGSLSDIITVANNDQGVATIAFQSDPIATPLPAALPLLAGGLGGMGVFARWRKRRTEQAIAA
jgi:hypothetical protein